jgi:hypothetical protein
MKMDEENLVYMSVPAGQVLCIFQVNTYVSDVARQDDIILVLNRHQVNQSV